MKAQDTLYLKDGSTKVVKIIEIRPSLIKYRNSLLTDSIVQALPVYKLTEIRYQDGVSELFCDPKFKFKLYNPYFYVYYMDVARAMAKTNVLVGFGVGHEGLFKLINVRFNMLTVGAFYGAGLFYGKLEVNSFHESLSANFTDIFIPFGIQFDFGRDKFRFVFQGMVGPTFSKYYGQIGISDIEISESLAWGLKIRRSKLLGSLYFNSTHYSDIAYVLKYGLEF